ncbi:ABC-2 transporter permease [Sporolactobacillus sp. CPB3-1]|uniref:ABC-2 transporter permease n=1 Tax=Sporolactobacillus mangiferae TaxID=2940498 RepID=A0ABT0MD59_9BACL|nr:ABC-2 transporter permease [Sporolactobacillus mangiferae]MCL1632811.1 ABC-2 transporter permease [Sporolactobacillus mangiferae]
MLINLILKDFILIKKYLVILVAFAVVAPVYLASQMGNGAISFFLVLLYVSFIAFSQVSMIENKYRGNALLCATPYRRKSVVQAKYAFLLIIFLLTVLIQFLVAAIISSRMATVSLTGINFSLFFFSLFFSFFIPLQYKFGYEKMRMVMLAIIFCMPFALGYLIRWLNENEIHLTFSLPLPDTLFQWLPGITGILLVLLSLLVSQRIFERKDL